ncbi:MAG: ribonuclease III domain-containing protein [Patescibacteria group bacterium]
MKGEPSVTHESRRSIIEKTLGVTFRNHLLLMEALTHPSYASEGVVHPVRNFQRLEFLGDTVLQMEVTEAIYGMFPQASDGDLTIVRSALVCNETLGRIGMELNLDAAAYLSWYMRMSSCMFPDTRSYLCACLLEALLGALYLDQGHDACRDVVGRHIVQHLQALCEDYRIAKRDPQTHVVPPASMTVVLAPEPPSPPVPLTPSELEALVADEDQEQGADVIHALCTLVVQHFPKAPTFAAYPASPRRTWNGTGMYVGECRVCGIVVTRSSATTKRDAIRRAAGIAFRHFDRWKENLLLMSQTADPSP